MTPTNRIPLVQNGTVDLECSTTTNTLARQRDVDFSPSIFIAGVAAAVKTRSGIDSFADLGGKTVATVSGSTSIQLLRALRKADKTEINEIHGKDTSETFLLLTGDSAAAMILEDVQLAGLMKSGLPKWVPPNNVNLNFPMSDSIKEAYKNPNNKGV